MSLALTAGTLALIPGMSTFFLASGGTPPYTYSLRADGVGGSINSSTGQYTAPSALTGIDTVIAKDSLGAKVAAQMLVGTPLQLVCDIIQNQLGLPNGRVYLWDQKIIEPTDAGLFVVISVQSCKPFGSRLPIDGSGGGLNTIGSVNMLATLGIDIISRSSDALDRKEEVILALKSQYSQSQQEINSFYLAPLSTGFVNLSEVDGAAIPYRFHIDVNMQYCFTKTIAVPYYNTTSLQETVQQ